MKLIDIPGQMINKYKNIDTRVTLIYFRKVGQKGLKNEDKNLFKIGDKVGQESLEKRTK